MIPPSPPRRPPRQQLRLHASRERSRGEARDRTPRRSRSRGGLAASSQRPTWPRRARCCCAASSRAADRAKAQHFALGSRARLHRSLGAQPSSGSSIGASHWTAASSSAKKRLPPCRRNCPVKLRLPLAALLLATTGIALAQQRRRPPGRRPPPPRRRGRPAQRLPRRRLRRAGRDQPAAPDRARQPQLYDRLNDYTDAYRERQLALAGAAARRDARASSIRPGSSPAGRLSFRLFEKEVERRPRRLPLALARLPGDQQRQPDGRTSRSS